MSLKDTVQADLKKAMLAKDVIARETLRMLKADLVSRELELGKELDEAEETAVVKRGIKSRQDSIEQYEQGGRPETAEKERKEIAVLEAYLPKQLTEDEIRDAVKALVEELGLSSKKDMGRLMKELMARHPGRVDGKTASRLASEALS